MSEPLLEHLRSIPDMMAGLLPTLRQSAKDTFTPAEAAGLRRVIITGCGNSLCVAMAARQAFLELTGVDIQVCNTMELARYLPRQRLAAAGTVVLVISNSGQATRVTELARRIKKAGGQCVAVCGNQASALWQLSSHHLPVVIPPFDFRPDVRSFSPPLLALVFLAAEIGVAQGTCSPDTYSGVQAAIEQIPHAIAGALPLMETQAQAAAATLKACHSIETIGSGWDAPTAQFVHGKILAACGLPTVSMNSEDWFHLYYFSRQPEGVGIVLVSNAHSPSQSRDFELLETAAGLKRPVVVITDAPSLFGDLPCITAPAAGYGFLNPLVQHVAAALLPVQLSKQIGEIYHRDAALPFTACRDYGTLNGSAMVEFD